MTISYGKVIDLKNAIELREDLGTGLTKKQDQELIKMINKCFEILERRLR
mgnify:CR=1 FL=1